ncbi:NAD(P)-dependent oxidoreductase [Streptomyces sp. KLMMK]|uniref:NAD(P)-dependent oxidoreductase n=1 Tax=Streptomyces sp. KLMMK TaxID=3109353 RepID=UPI003FA725A2
MRECDVLVIAVQDSPGATGVIDRDLVRAPLKNGAIVVTVTRSAAIDTKALHERVMAGEPVWDADVYDEEPLPADDPLIGRHNVVHPPCIAGRTRDGNLAVADVIADDFLRVFRGEHPVHMMTPARPSVRTAAPGTTTIKEWMDSCARQPVRNRAESGRSVRASRWWRVLFERRTGSCWCERPSRTRGPSSGLSLEAV